MVQLEKRHTMPYVKVKDYLNALNRHIGLIEECIEKGLIATNEEDEKHLISIDNLMEYRKFVEEINRYSKIKYNASKTLGIINDLEENYSD